MTAAAGRSLLFNQHWRPASSIAKSNGAQRAFLCLARSGDGPAKTCKEIEEEEKHLGFGPGYRQRNMKFCIFVFSILKRWKWIWQDKHDLIIQRTKSWNRLRWLWFVSWLLIWWKVVWWISISTGSLSIPIIHSHIMQGNNLSWLGWSLLSLRTKKNFNLLNFERGCDLSQEMTGYWYSYIVWTIIGL